MKHFEVPLATTLARQIADAFESEDIPYAIGGAIAYSAHSAPRATNDVDLNLFIDDSEVPKALAVLERLGINVDRDKALRQIKERGDFTAFYKTMRIDFFLPAIPLSRSAANRLVTLELEGRPAKFLAAEDIMLFKLLFFRPKDQWDLEKMLAFRHQDLDLDYIRRWLLDMVGAEDQRVRFFEQALTAARTK